MKEWRVQKNLSELNEKRTSYDLSLTRVTPVATGSLSKSGWHLEVKGKMSRRVIVRRGRVREWKLCGRNEPKVLSCEDQKGDGVTCKTLWEDKRLQTYNLTLRRGRNQKRRNWCDRKPPEYVREPKIMMNIWLMRV